MKHHEDPLIITTDIGPNATSEKVMIGSESLMNVLYYNAFIKMGCKKEVVVPQREHYKIHVV